MRMTYIITAATCAVAGFFNMFEGEYLKAFLFGLIAVKDIQIFNFMDD